MPDVLRIPTRPEVLGLPIERHWDGRPCDDRRRHGRVELSASGEGLFLAASLAHQRVPDVPTAPPGTRVDRLWETDVVECFLVGAGGRYLEVELGAGGHFLVLRFDAPRQLAEGGECRDFRPALDFASDDAGWRASLLLPWSLVPEGLRALDAFVAVGDVFLAHQRLPGDVPDFHQPEHFPRAMLVASGVRRGSGA